MTNIPQISLEKSTWYDKEYSILTSSNGFQWNEIFHGPLTKSKIILSAFKRIGYEEKKNRK